MYNIFYFKTLKNPWEIFETVTEKPGFLAHWLQAWYTNQERPQDPLN